MRPPSRAQRAAIARRQRDARLAPSARFLASVNLSAAQRDQGEVTVLDLSLVTPAQLRHPGVRWWWGARQTPAGFGAYCYLCDALVVTWARAYPMTRTAQAAVLAHRDQAHGSGRLTEGSESPASLAGADQSEGSPS